MRILAILGITLSFSVFSQKKVIDHTAYNDWKKVGETTMSNDGKYTAYTIKPLRGDGYLYVVNNYTGEIDSFPRAGSPKFTSDNLSLLFKITPGFDTLRNCELKKVKKDKWPKDSLGIYMLAMDSLVKIPKVKEFVVAEESGRFAYLSHENNIPSDKAGDSKKKKKKKKKKSKKEEPEIESDGNLLVVKKSYNAEVHYLKNVTSYEFSKSGEKLAYVMHRRNKVDSSHLWILDFKTSKDFLSLPGYSDIASYSFSPDEKQVAYVASLDTIEKGKVYQLNLYDLNSDQKRTLIDTMQANIDPKKGVSKNVTPYFSMDQGYVYFGISNKELKEEKDTLLESEKAKLDVWNWKDERIQPQQLIELSRDQRDAWLSVYDLKNNSFVILENEKLEIQHNDKNPYPFALGYDSKTYEAKHWEVPSKSDIYRVNVRTGEKTLLRKAAVYGINLSPKGDFYTYFNEKDLQQYLVNFQSKEESCITCGVKAEWLEDVNGMPMMPGPIGGISWMKPEGSLENELLIQSKYDIFRYQIAEKKLTQLTNVDGGDKKIRYSYSFWDSDSIYAVYSNMYIHGFYESDKSGALYLPKWHDGHLDLIEKHHSNHALTVVRKAKLGDYFVYQLSSIEKYPDLQVNTWKADGEVKQISNTNPQQVNYNWASVELISYKSYSGVPLEGLLYKPENYDPSKKYPLLVYFYELYSDELHNHYAPKPTASIIYPTEYASAGYFVLIPDIRYVPGHPAKGAYDCIMSATDRVLKLYPSVDSTRMGLQGQSWGGYQTAQLVTMTNRYKAAMAGAPVGNMFSAYGGIRWGSGINRQFQYEHTQSRIGKTIWDAPELYVENSPIFHLNKVQTPLLIMHNDADGAVPWYQGIELFTGLRRLGKPVWMLNYNGDDHNLMKNANRMDLSIRMRQFFDYYLMNQPAPVWLLDGVPALDKGKNYGLDLK